MAAPVLSTANAAVGADTAIRSRRFVSVGTKLVLNTFGVLVLTSVILYVNLTGRERANAIAGKLTAATMVVSLFVQSVSPRIDFDDVEGLRSDVRNLSENPDIDGVSVYSLDGTALGSWTRDGRPPPERPAAGDLGTVRVDDAHITLYRAIIGANRSEVGTAAFVFSLRRENAQYRESQLHIFVLTSVLAISTALVLSLFARRQIIARLRTLAHAAERLERGEKDVHVELVYNDEIAQLASAFNLMGVAIVERHARLAKELEIAAHIQTSILPKDFNVKGMAIAATMQPASEVGGDYFDILPTSDGCWVGVGDVTGHGVNAGLIMLMIQSIIATMVARDADALPRDVLNVVNCVLHENIRRRMGSDDHATLTVCRYRNDGSVTFAGAHEDIVVFRSKERRAEVVETPGTWVGAVRDVSHAMVDTTLHLGEGDVMVLYTDGVTEARNAGGEMFGMDRLVLTVERAAAAGDADSICANLLGEVMRWTHTQVDDVSLVVLQKKGDIVKVHSMPENLPGSGQRAESS